MTCTFSGCGLPLHSRGLCSGHYEMRRSTGELRPLKFRRGQSTIRDAEGRKCCNTCRAWKPESEFAQGKRELDGRRARCKQCCREVSSPAQRKYIANRIQKTMNITVEERDQMLESQGNCCAVCGRPEPGGRGRWMVDHDHACCPNSGRSCGRCIRGVLCSRCNLTLGAVHDSQDVLQAMIEYLERPHHNLELLRTA